MKKSKPLIENHLIFLVKVEPNGLENFVISFDSYDEFYSSMKLETLENSEILYSETNHHCTITTIKFKNGSVYKIKSGSDYYPPVKDVFMDVVCISDGKHKEYKLRDNVNTNTYIGYMVNSYLKSKNDTEFKLTITPTKITPYEFVNGDKIFLDIKS